VRRLKRVEKQRRNKCIIVISRQCVKKPKSKTGNLYISYRIYYRLNIREKLGWKWWESIREARNLRRNVTSGVKCTVRVTGGQSRREYMKWYCWCQKNQAGWLCVKSLGEKFACCLQNVINLPGKQVYRVIMLLWSTEFFFVDFWYFKLGTRFISCCVVSFADVKTPFHFRTIMCFHKPSLKVKEGYDKDNA